MHSTGAKSNNNVHECFVYHKMACSQSKAYGGRLLQAAKVGSSEWQLGQTYTSEALNLLGKAPEAVLHLHAALNGLLDAEASTDHEVNPQPSRHKA